MHSRMSAITGATATETNVDVIANNIANINTTAYKRARAEFSDLMYIADRMAGVPNAAGQSTVPEGAMIGLGVQVVAVRRVFQQGSFNETGNTFDLAIQGRGWFEVEDANGNTFYTRAGAFNLNENGQIVTLNGNLVQPVITLPAETGKNGTVTINQNGVVYYQGDADPEPIEAGRIRLVNFINEAGLEPVGDNLFRETQASFAPITGNPGEENFGTVRQGYLEASNVQSIQEITNLISAQRAYEMNVRVIQADDEMSATVVKDLR